MTDLIAWVEGVGVFQRQFGEFVRQIERLRVTLALSWVWNLADVCVSCCDKLFVLLVLFFEFLVTFGAFVRNWHVLIILLLLIKGESKPSKVDLVLLLLDEIIWLWVIHKLKIVEGISKTLIHMHVIDCCSLHQSFLKPAFFIHDLSESIDLDVSSSVLLHQHVCICNPSISHLQKLVFHLEGSLGSRGVLG